MFLMSFNPGVTELLPNSGDVHVVPPEVLDQAEDPSQELPNAAAWARKAHLIDHAEYSEALARRA